MVVYCPKRSSNCRCPSRGKKPFPTVRRHHEHSCPDGKHLCTEPNSTLSSYSRLAPSFRTCSVDNSQEKQDPGKGKGGDADILVENQGVEAFEIEKYHGHSH
eukprot:scaffold1754_cov105-Cylindrotheca_fusiformis.AAC.2